MQFITTILALAATSSAAVLPRSEQGSWFAQVTVSPDHSVYVTAKFTSPSYPDGLRNACVENPFADPPYKRCDHLEFDYVYDGQCKTPYPFVAKSTELTYMPTVLNLTQKIQLPTPQTVYGEAYIPFTKDLGDGRTLGEGVVEVTRATA
jgi:hypothetical protein